MTLSHLSITHSSGFEFILSVEQEKLNSQIVGCFCFVNTKMASVKLDAKGRKKSNLHKLLYFLDSKKTLYAGIAQELGICLQAGSMSISKQSTLKARFLDAECGAEFLVCFI